MLKLSQTILSNLKSNNKNVPILRLDKYLKSTIAEAKNTQPTHFDHEEEEIRPKKHLKSNNSIVAAAFASLNAKSNVNINEIETPLIDNKLKKATTINELLSVSEGDGISRRHALKVVSTLAEWSSSGKARLTDFENDARFIKLCRILSKGARVNRNIVSRSEDLSTILSVTADDEAARLVSNLTLSQMIKVVSTLTSRKRRSVLLLRTLAYNITASGEKLNLKQSADLLYSMCVLNFVDENLLAKICGDIMSEINKDFKKSSVVGSIVTSLGLLKYKNAEILDCLSEWMLQNNTICRSQDMFSLFVTLATVNYLPSNSEELFKVILPQLTLSEARKPLVWLDLVWSLVVLNQASKEHVASVLNENFVKTIEGSNTSSISAKVKLLNINGAAKLLLKNYNVETLPPSSSIHNLSCIKTKEKGEIAESVVETLKNLIHSGNCLHTDANTGHGFLIDVECLLDKKSYPFPLTEENFGRNDLMRIAVMAYDYHNMCIGKVEPSGANVLACRLLEALRYRVLVVPYTEYKISDKLVHRVQYLENRLKNIVK